MNNSDSEQFLRTFSIGKKYYLLGKITGGLLEASTLRRLTPGLTMSATDVSR